MQWPEGVNKGGEGQENIATLEETAAISLVSAFAALGRDKQYLMRVHGKLGDEMRYSFIDNFGAWRGLL